MTVVFSYKKAHLLLSKGATSAILESCSSAILKKKVVPVDDKVLKIIDAKATELASKGLRVLALASRLDKNRKDKDYADKDPAKMEKDLTYLGLVGIIDPPREGVARAVLKCKDAGIRVCMITGEERRR